MDFNNLPNKALLESIFLQSSNVIAITNSDLSKLKFEFVNPAFLEMTGYKLEEVIGKSPKMLQGPKTKRDMTRRLKEACLKGEAFRGDNINYKKDGSIYIVGWTVTPIKDEEGNITNFLSIQKDITKIKELEEENIKIQKLATLNQLSSGLTHELNTALTNCKGSLEMMGYDIDEIKDEMTKSYIKDDMDSVKKGINYISFLTNSLHYLTNSDIPEKKDEDIYGVILEALKEYEKLENITECKINGFSIFDEEFKPQSISLQADKRSLKHLFMIIIDNALDELMKSEKDKNILEINIKSSNDNTIIEIVDNAGGIDQESISNIFDPLSKKKELGGLGIGLYVAKNIVSGYNGRIDVISNKPYTMFKIII